MNTRSTKAIFLDIDGTLITGGKGPFNEDREVMDEAARKGHLLFLNTGRSFANIPSEILELSSLKGIAAGGGAHVLFAGAGDFSAAVGSSSAIGGSRAAAGSSRFETVYHRWISDAQLREVFSWCVNYSHCCLLEGERECYIISQFPRHYSVRDPILVDSLEDFKSKSGGDFVTKMTLYDFFTKPAAVGKDPLTGDEYRFLESIFTVNRFPDYSEAIIKGENKAKAIELILAKLGMERKDSIAIGDGVNDLDMIRFAGLGIAMGNACGELKAAAGAITGDCGKGGVAQALKKYVL